MLLLYQFFINKATVVFVATVIATATVIAMATVIAIATDVTVAVKVCAAVVFTAYIINLSLSLLNKSGLFKCKYNLNCKNLNSFKSSFIFSIYLKWL